jgi:DNA-directed RNA polymerase subunit D
MFRDYSASGPALLTDPDDHMVGTFILEGTTTTIANTLRRCILTDTRSVSFRADLTNAADPGVVIRKNTSVIFNEMLAHRLTLIPLGVRRIDEFDPTRYECVLRIANTKKGPIEPSSVLHVKAGDFVVREKKEDGSFEELGGPATAALFPTDSITKDTALILTLRPQWNPEQPPEEIDLTAYPVVGTGREFIGFSPVSQSSFENTPDPDPVRQEQFFHAWLAEYKKIADPAAVEQEALLTLRREWSTMAIQRCFKIDEATGQPNSFNFTVESVGIRPVSDIVAEAIQAVVDMVGPFADADKTNEELGIRTQPVDNRMTGVDVIIEGHEHTLGNLLQTLITETYLDNGDPDSPITFCGYKVKHPLHRAVTLRFGIRDGISGDPALISREVIATAAGKARAIFEALGRSWAALMSGATGVGGEAMPGLEGGGAEKQDATE